MLRPQSAEIAGGRATPTAPRRAELLDALVAYAGQQHADFGEETVREGLSPLERLLGGTGQATVLLAALRGRLLDLLATGDTARVERALERLRTLVAEPSDEARLGLSVRVRRAQPQVAGGAAGETSRSPLRSRNTCSRRS